MTTYNLDIIINYDPDHGITVMIDPYNDHNNLTVEHWSKEDKDFACRDLDKAKAYAQTLVIKYNLDDDAVFLNKPQETF